jgi:hypothetical protein
MQMEKAEIVAMLSEDGHASIMSDGQAGDQVVLAAHAVAVVAAHHAVCNLNDGNSPEHALNTLIDTIRNVYWELYKEEVKAAAK